MADMMNFSEFILEALANFLGTPPIFYLFGLILFCFICKAVRILIKP